MPEAERVIARSVVEVGEAGVVDETAPEAYVEVA